MPAIRGVEVRTCARPEASNSANVIDTEPEAAENAVIGRVERRMYAPKGPKSLGGLPGTAASMRGRRARSGRTSANPPSRCIWTVSRG